MIDVILRILDISVGSIEKLSNIIQSQKKSNKEDLCYALYRFFETVDKIIMISERLLAQLPGIENNEVRNAICRDQEEIAKLIAKTWRPLATLRHYMRIADPKIAKEIDQAFGPKLTLILFLAKVSPLLTQESKKGTLKVLKKVDFNALQGSYWEINNARLLELQKSGVVAIESLDFEPGHINLVLRRGQSNLVKLRKLRNDIRKFMIANFEKEDFFFSKVSF